MASSTPVRKASTWSSSTNPSTTTPRSASGAALGSSSPAMAPPRLPHSTSSPSIPTSSSSPLPQLASPNGSKTNSQNYHPYLIQSTSSSLLTRSNSSPSQPIHALGRHRPSRSMSSLAQSAMSEGDLSNSEDKEERRRSMESPSAAPRRIVRSSKSGTLPSFLEHGSPTASRKWVELPLNPKLWSPSELATYLDQTLRHGGPDGTGQRLPGPLVEDIKTWVLRQQVNGRTFLRGNADTWGASSRPPPFLPMLLSLSRRLRRASLQGNPPDVLDSASSVLLETDEEEDETTGVRRMANAIERRDSTSEASDVEEERVLRAQLTGGNGGWERWGLKRQNTGGSVGGTRRRDSIREELAQEHAGLGGQGTSPDEIIVTPLMGDEEIVRGPAVLAHQDDVLVKRESGIEEASDEGGDDQGVPGGTLKAPPAGLAGPDAPAGRLSTSPGVEGTFLHPARLSRENSDGTPRSERSRSEVTPTPERPGPSTGGLGFSPQSEDDIVAHRAESPRPKPSPAASRYASLRGKGRVPSLRGRTAEDGYDTSDEASAASRKVTLRPSHAHIATIFDIDAKSPREAELEKQLAEVTERVKVLETRLEEASRPVSPTSPSSTVSRAGFTTPTTGAMGYVLGKLGLLPADEGLPTRVGELPGYLFLVGVGVGAVMVRVLFGRAR